MKDKLNGVIRAEEAYSKSIAIQRLGISQRFWDKLLDQGLPYISIGHTRWVTGHDLIEHFKRHSQTKNGQAQ